MTPPDFSLTQQIQNALPDIPLQIHRVHDEWILDTSSEFLLTVIKQLRDDPHLRFNQLMDLCGVDYPERAMRFEVVYQLLSLPHNRRIRIKVALAPDQAMPSLTPLFSCANWYEREAWDMYGIVFQDHPALERLLTEEGFEGFPLRKDFCVTGYTEIRYDEAREKIVHEPIHLAQPFRQFDFLSPWEGMCLQRLPGDEKATESQEA